MRYRPWSPCVTRLYGGAQWANRSTFHRVSDEICPNKQADDLYGVAHENEKVLKLLLNQASLKKQLLGIVQQIYRESVDNEVTFEHMPDNSDVLDEGTHLNRVLVSDYLRKSSDCREWSPELPKFVGIYHAYVRGFNKVTTSLFLNRVHFNDVIFEPCVPNRTKGCTSSFWSHAVAATRYATSSST